MRSSHRELSNAASLGFWFQKLTTVECAKIHNNFFLSHPCMLSHSHSIVFGGILKMENGGDVNT